MDGKIAIDPLITHTLPLEDINKGFELMKSRRVDPLGGAVLMVAGVETLAEHRCFGGVQGFYRHASRTIGLPMRFAVYRPPQAEHGPVPALFYLAGLTCTEETFAIKAGAQRVAAELGLMLVMPDTSPRDTGVAGADASWDFGTGAGFYLDATQPPWSTHWRMGSYVADELRGADRAALPGAAATASASSATRWAATARSRWRCASRRAGAACRPSRRSPRRCSVRGASRRSAAISATTAPPGRATMRPNWSRPVRASRRS